MSAKILVAVQPEPRPVVAEALKGYQLLQPADVPHAKEMIREDQSIDLFVIGVLFDDSKALDLIKFLRLESSYTHTPIIAVRLLPSLHANLVRRVIDTTQPLTHLSEYIEQPHLSPNTPRLLRKMVEKHLPPEKLALKPAEEADRT